MTIATLLGREGTGSIVMSNHFTNRRADRKKVRLLAQCRTASGLRGSGEITDITAEGCCVTADSLFFRIGTRVVIRPEGMEGLTGVVRWIEGMRAGIEFDSPLYGPVVDHLANQNSASVEEVS